MMNQYGLVVMLVKCFNRNLGLMDTDLYDYEALFNTKFDMDKSTRLEYGDSMMTHAMLFTGVFIMNDKTIKWRVENSWGQRVVIKVII